MRSIYLFIIMLGIALPAAAEIYQWRDAQGGVHYSDTPPSDGNATTLHSAAKPHPPAQARDETEKPEAAGDGTAASKAAKAADEAAKPKTLAEKDAEFRQRRAEAAEAKAKAEKERQRAAERERDCVQARSELAALESGQRVSRFNSRGEREVLDDAGRTDQIARTRKFVESDCK